MGHRSVCAFARLLAPGGLLLALASLALPASASTPSRSPLREPAYLLIELPSHRVLARSRPDVLSTRIAPGSILKLVTLVAAFEQGIADPETRVVCRRTIEVDGRTLACVHPDFHRGLTAAEALGHSCNTYFATLARRLDRGRFDRTLVRVGLPPSAPSTPLVTAALGLGGVAATASDILEAFCRLASVSQTPLRLDDPTRQTLRLGLETAARAGTASAFADAGYGALAKTGTAPMPGGGFHGIVTAVVDAERPTHAIIVIAPGTSGANAAALAAEILARHRVSARDRRGDAPSPVPYADAGREAQHGVTVGIARREGGYRVESMSLEDYVARGVAGETDGTMPAAALDALAVTIRTWALVNRGRHAAEGFDQCDLTHCVSLRPPTPAAVAAAARTRGRVLTNRGSPAEVYLSASCGGHTERPSRVWDGAPDRAWLPAAPDPACAGDAPWVSELVEPHVRRVLQAAGLRGTTVERLAVLSRTSSGRVDLLRVEGFVPNTVAATVFRATAGRLLGWQTVKSTLFDIERTGAGFRLTGRGLGHGVGLCVRGASARASGGASAEAILAAYFPGLDVTFMAVAPELRVLLPEADRAHLPAIRELAVRLVHELAADLGIDVPARIDVRFHASVEAYTRATGLPWWTSGRTRGTAVDLLPLAVLTRRGLLEAALRHELVHVLTDRVLADRPWWVREGLARVKAGEWDLHAARATDTRDSPSRSGCPTDAELRAPASADAWRRAYDAAAQCVARQLAAGTSWRDLR